MRLKRIKNAEEIVSSSPYAINNPQDYKGKWKLLFNNDNNIEIELGIGKGKFIIEKARAFPHINFIGIEKYATPLVSTVKSLEDESISNLKIINIDVILLNEVFEKEINKIYLNFSDPWPKKRHAKRRLSNISFLKLYDNLFESKKTIEMKTDNELLFEYSKESFKDYGYKIIKTSTNYHDKITTEYEDKFIKKGLSIFYIKVEKNI